MLVAKPRRLRYLKILLLSPLFVVVVVVVVCLFAIYVMISKSKVACKEEKALNAVHIS